VNETTSVRVTELPVEVFDAIKREAAKEGITTDSGACRRALIRYVRGEAPEQVLPSAANSAA